MPDGGFTTEITSTLFYGYAATRKMEARYSWPQLRANVLAATAKTKAELPWIKLARFGDVKTEKGSLRHDANVLAITGIEADYDGEKIHLAEAVERLEKAGVKALVYTSPSHTEDTPRWRVLCPTSTELPPERREHLVGRLNGLLGGILAGESFTLSQAYYFGSINKSPSHLAELVDGQPIDLCDELDATWIGRPATKANGTTNAGKQGKADTAELFAEIISGAAFHAATVRLAGVWARGGVAYMDARRRLEDAFDAVPEAERDARWQARRGDVDRCLEGIYGKEAKRKDSGERPGATSGKEEPNGGAWPEPIDFLADCDLTGAPRLQPHHLPTALAPFVFDTAARMGVDPAAVALAAIVTCASVASDEWSVQPKVHDDTWTENPRLWGAIVGDPSILKTPVIKVCTRPVDLMDAAARARHAEAMRSYRAELAALKADKGNATQPPKPKCDRYMVEGTTTEALSEVLRDDDEANFRTPAGKVLVRQDEMSGWLGDMDRYKAGGKGGGDRAAYLTLFNGGRHTIDRIGRGSFAIPNWSACVLGGIQPEPIQRIAKEAADDGLLQRFLYCVPAAQDDGEDRRPDHDALAQYEALFPALAALRPTTSFPGAKARAVVLAEGAHRHRQEIDLLAKAQAAMPDVSTRQKAALGKYRGIFARLALTFHLIEIADANARGINPGPVATVLSEETARRAASYMREILLPHMLRAEALLFLTPQTGHTHWIAGYILASDTARDTCRVTLRDVTRAYGPLRAPERRRELVGCMETLEVMGWLSSEPPENPAKPIAAWQVNPKLHVSFAEYAAIERARRKRLQAEMTASMRRFRQENPR
jgi:hypothetical protein